MKKTIRIVLFIALTFLIIYGAYRVLSWKDTNGDYLSSVVQLKNTPDNTVDAVFVGSSHVFCGVAPNVLWDKFGIAAFDMTVSGMDKDSAYYYTKELLKSQSPKVVCVDLFPLTFDKHEVLGNEYRNMLSMGHSKNSFELIDAYSEPSNKLNYQLKWPIIHTRYKEITKKDFLTYGLSLFGRGENLQYETSGADIISPRDNNESSTLSEKNQKWIDDFISLSKEYSFELIFMITPYSAPDREMEIFNSAEAYIEKIDGVRVLNGIRDESINLNCSTDFCDRWHLNAFGAQKFSEWIGRAICLTSEFSSHDKDERYDLWNQDSLYYFTVNVNTAIQDLIEKGDFEGALLRVSENDNLLLVHIDGNREVFVNSDDVKIRISFVGKTTYYPISRYVSIKTETNESGELEQVSFLDEDITVNSWQNSFFIYDTFNEKIVVKWTE